MTLNDVSTLPALLAAIESCYPLCVAISQFSWSKTPEDGDEIGDEYSDVQDWLREANPAVQAEAMTAAGSWLEEGPDPELGVSFHVPCDSLAAAFEYLSQCKSGDRAALDITLVDGESPGNDVQYARLRGDVERANLLAKAIGLDVRFRKDGQ
jgi:hypothetical protein